MGVISDGEDEYGIPSAPWLHLLEPQWRAWREHQFLKGRNPDPYIEDQLREAGRWPPRPKSRKKQK
jgi:hypothetical protein